MHTVQAFWQITASKEGRREMSQISTQLSEQIVQELQLYGTIVAKLAEQKTAVIKNNTDLLLTINEELIALQRQANQQAQYRQKLIETTGETLTPQQEVAVQQSLHQIRLQVMDNQEMLHLASDFVSKEIGFWVDLFKANSENYDAKGESGSATDQMQYSTIIKEV